LHGNPLLSSELVEQVVVERRSVRAFRPESLDRELVERILNRAARAPSGANMQPWKVHVLMEAALEKLTSKMTQQFVETGHEPTPEYGYYPREWREPYLARRREVGYALYSAVGVQRGDRPAMQGQQGRNYTFFGAPVGLIFTVDRDLEFGSLLDIGMFMQNVMILAVANGLATCPQGAIANYHELIRDELGIPSGEMILCGMAVGRPDLSAPENLFSTNRVPASDFATFHLR
jgi:nitroreductase